MMAGTLRVRRSRGALSGLLLVLLGIWGALIPFVGPYFNYAYTPDRAWTSTSGRIWLEVLPGVVTLAGGVVVLLSRFRPAAVFASWLAALAGAWFAVGHLVAGHWTGLPGAGTPVGGATRSVLEQIGFFTGLGVAIVFVAALALGRFTVVAVADAATSRAGREAAAADAGAAQSQVPARSSAPRIKPVPVFRGRSRTSEPADADTTETPAEAARTS
ncbi:MAG TPA: hypothetical protein VMB74_12995 [Streptosporangiaceae bacterium]|nr:hypothetical protein [Streptosporangiaceae bacterium]